MPPVPENLLGVFHQFEKFAAPQPTLLTVHLANVTAYYQDTVDLIALGKLPLAPINTANLSSNNFFPLEVIGDIVQINSDTTVKGLYISKNLVTRSSPTPSHGTMISDASITGFRHDIFKIMYPDPDPMPSTSPNMEIGSITAAGVSGQPFPPGGPLVIGGGDWAITGGTGTFLGVGGLMGGQGGTGGGGGGIRAASVTEDPSLRRANAGPNYTATMFLYVIPLMPPRIVEVFHRATVNHPAAPVTQAHPAHGGERLILYATGLGPVRYQSGNAWIDVPIGQPFPTDNTVIAPVTLTIGNTPVPIAPQDAHGFEGFSNGYFVDLILPMGIQGSPGPVPIQLTSAWIQSAAWTLYVQ
jgi:hypothetical protein